MKKAKVMNHINHPEDVGDEREKGYWEGRQADYKAERRVQRYEYRVYRVREGDSYFSIAQDVYRDQRYTAEIARANRGTFKLYPGMKIKLPPKKEEVESPAIANEDQEYPVLANEGLAHTGSKIQQSG